MKAFLYVLYSESRDRFYVGASRDFDRRLAEHQRGQTASTRGGAPWKVVCLIEFPETMQARRAELFLKRMKSRSGLKDLIVACR